jgi:hypothetical protein
MSRRFTNPNPFAVTIAADSGPIEIAPGASADVPDYPADQPCPALLTEDVPASSEPPGPSPAPKAAKSAAASEPSTHAPAPAGDATEGA